MENLTDLKEQFDLAVNDLQHTSKRKAWFGGLREQSSLIQRRVFFRALSEYKKSGAVTSFFDWLLENQDAIISLIERVIKIFLGLNMDVQLSGDSSRMAFTTLVNEQVNPAPIPKPPMPSVKKAAHVHKETKSHKAK